MKRFRRLSLALVGLVVVLGVTEAVARVACESPQLLAPYRSDPELGYRMPPNVRERLFDRRGGYGFWTNAGGSRGRDFPYRKRLADDGQTRILFIGGTTLHARSVRDEEWMATVTERLATVASGQGTMALAMSGDGMSLSQGLIRLRRHGRRVSPDAIVLVVHPEDDVPASTPRLAVGATDALRPYVVGPEGSRRTTYVRPARTWLRNHSRAFASLEAACIARGLWSLAPVESASDATDLRRDALFDPDDADRGPWRDAWREFARILVDFRDEATALHARLLVLVVPSRRQVSIDVPTLVDETRAQVGGTARGARDLNLPERRIADACDAHGIDYRLLAGVLRREARPGGDRLFGIGGRLNGVGHPWAGVAVAAWWCGEPDEWGCDRASVLGGGPRPMLPNADVQPHERWLFPGHGDCLGPRWRRIRSDVAGAGPGTTVREGRGAVALAARPGDLLVRGVVPDSATLPLTCTVEVPGGRSESVVLEKTGSFRVRIPSPIPETMRPPHAHGYVAVRIGDGARDRVGPVIRSVGFHVRGTREHGAPTGCNGRLWVAAPLVLGSTVEAGVLDAPRDAEGLLIVARAPALVPTPGDATIFVDTASIVAAVPIATDAAGRATATFDVPPDLAHRVVLQALFAVEASDRGFATTRAIIARPFRKDER